MGRSQRHMVEHHGKDSCGNTAQPLGEGAQLSLPLMNTLMNTIIKKYSGDVDEVLDLELETEHPLPTDLNLEFVIVIADGNDFMMSEGRADVQMSAGYEAPDMIKSLINAAGEWPLMDVLEKGETGRKLKVKPHSGYRIENMQLNLIPK